MQRRFVEKVLDQLRRTGRVRMVVLKARQQGLSTVISALQYWWLSQRQGPKGPRHGPRGRESTTTLFDMYRRIHDNIPDIVRPSTKYSSRTELVFDKLDSGLRIATAGGRGVARGETLTFAHLSEVAFWPVAFANTNFNGLVQAIPDEDGTFIFLESTAQGVTGKFYEMANGADRMDHICGTVTSCSSPHGSRAMSIANLPLLISSVPPKKMSWLSSTSIKGSLRTTNFIGVVRR